MPKFNRAFGALYLEKMKKSLVHPAFNSFLALISGCKNPILDIWSITTSCTHCTLWTINMLIIFQGNQGPEPYMSEYENGVQLPRMLEDIGFKNVNERAYSYFESVFTATK